MVTPHPDAVARQAMLSECLAQSRTNETAKSGPLAAKLDHWRLTHSRQDAISAPSMSVATTSGRQIT